MNKSKNTTKHKASWIGTRVLANRYSVFTVFTFNVFLLSFHCKWRSYLRLLFLGSADRIGRKLPSRNELKRNSVSFSLNVLLILFNSDPRTLNSILNRPSTQVACIKFSLSTLRMIKSHLLSISLTIPISRSYSEGLRIVPDSLVSNSITVWD